MPSSVRRRDGYDARPKSALTGHRVTLDASREAWSELVAQPEIMSSTARTD